MAGPIVQEADILGNPSYLLRIADTSFSGLTKTSLIQAGNINFVAELVQLTRRDLFRIRCFGRRGFDEVEAMLSALGLDLETKIVFSGPKSGFRARLNEAHRKAYACLRPGTELVQMAGRKMLSRLKLPVDLADKIRRDPVLALAVQQFVGAREVCSHMGLTDREMYRLLKTKVAAKCDPT